MTTDQARHDALALRALGYPPNAKLFTQVAVSTELSADDLSASLQRLYEAKLIDELNGWIFRVRPPSREPLSRDDVEWLTGTGRFGQ